MKEEIKSEEEKKQQLDEMIQKQAGLRSAVDDDQDGAWNESNPKRQSKKIKNYNNEMREQKARE